MNWSICGGLEQVQFSAPTLWPKPCSCCVDFNQELEEPHAVKFLATLLFIRKDKFGASMVARHCIPCSVEKEVTCRVWNKETCFFVLLIILTTVLPKDVTWAHWLVLLSMVSFVFCCHLWPTSFLELMSSVRKMDFSFGCEKKSFSFFFWHPTVYKKLCVGVPLKSPIVMRCLLTLPICSSREDRLLVILMSQKAKYHFF